MVRKPVKTPNRSSKFNEKASSSNQELESVRVHDIINLSSDSEDRSSRNARVRIGRAKGIYIPASNRIQQANKASNSAIVNNDIPEEFREMLAESYKEKPEMFTRKTPVKGQQNSNGEGSSKSTSGPMLAGSPLSDRKRKRESNEIVGQQSAKVASEDSSKSGTSAHTKSSHQQTINVEESDEEDDEDEFGDVDWENIDLSKAESAKKAQEPLVLNLSKAEDAKPRRKNQRPAPTARERKIRFEIHKVHLLCLLSHVSRRSAWCNDSKVHKLLAPLVETKKKQELLTKTIGPKSLFRPTLKVVASNFRKQFHKTVPGLRKALWSDGKPKDPDYGDPPVNLHDFRIAAEDLEGSRDLGAQLFCAMLRAIGLSARLVVSLQVFNYTFKTGPATQTPTKTEKFVDYRTSEDDAEDAELNNLKRTRFMGDVNKAYGGPGPYGTTKSPVTPGRKTGAVMQPDDLEESSDEVSKKKKQRKVIRIHDPRMPVYWVEVFEEARQEWVSVDPMVTGEVGYSHKLEPAIADAMENEMAYVVAFEAEGQAKDVTRRYVKSYNGRTRTLRVEAVPDGDKWWRRALRRFRRGYPLDRDQIEEASLREKELSEGIPNNIEAFKTHPHFAIERHLRRNEVIYPKKQVATCTKHGGKDKKPIPVYKRSDVKIVKTARQWYSLGREVKIGEQPLKTTTVRTSRTRKDASDDEQDGEEEESEEGMYAEFQTSLYIPPPIVFGVVPKNGFGNLDVFVPSMVPPGGVHLPNKSMVKAAKLLGVDYAEAVTGFEFKGRASTAVIKGIVAAVEFKDALEAIVSGFEAEAAEAAEMKKQEEMLKLWRKFIIGMRIKERLDEYGPIEDEEEIQNELDKQFELDLAAEDQGGGFLPEDAIVRKNEDASKKSDSLLPSGILASSSSKGKQRQEHISDDDYDGGFLLEDQVDDIEDTDAGGGFIKDDDEEESADYGGGGFMLEDEPEEPAVTSQIHHPPVDDAYDTFFAEGGYARKRRRRMVSADLEDDDDDDDNNDDESNKNAGDEQTMSYVDRGKGKDRQTLPNQSRQSKQTEEISPERLREIEAEVQQFLEMKAETGNIIFSDQTEDDGQVGDEIEEDHIDESDMEEDVVRDNTNKTSIVSEKSHENESVHPAEDTAGGNVSPMSIDPVDGDGKDSVKDDKSKVEERSIGTSTLGDRVGQKQEPKQQDELAVVNDDDDGNGTQGLDDDDDEEGEGDDDVKDDDFEYEDDAGWYSP